MLGGAAFAFAALLSINVPAGPPADARGIVLSSMFVPADGAPPSGTVSFRLSDGRVATVNTETHVVLLPGQGVQLKVHRRLLTGTPRYAIVTSGSK